MKQNNEPVQTMVVLPQSEYQSLKEGLQEINNEGQPDNPL